MLTIGNKTYSHTIPIDDQLVDAIATLPSPFSNLKEDRLAVDKELFKILTKEIDLALKLKDESGIGFASNQVQTTIDKISKLKKNLQGKTEVDYSLYKDTLFDLYNNFYPPLKDGANTLRIRKLMLDGYQSRSDKDSYMILEGEVGFSDYEKIGTSNVWDCAILIIRNKKTLKIALTHIDTSCGEKQIANIFRYLEDGDKEVVLVGASSADDDNNKRNIKEILKAILKSVSKGDNVSIQKSYVLAKSYVNAVVVDPTTLDIRSLIPGIQRNNGLSQSLSRAYLYYNSSKKRGTNIRPIEVAFDFTKSKKYLPWESYKSTICANYFEKINYSSSNEDYYFTYNPLLSIKDNRLIVNKEELALNLKKIEEAATSSLRENRDNAFFSSSQLKIIIRLVQAYANAFNDLMNKIESYIPDTISDRAKITSEIFAKLRKKKIFVDEGCEVFNKILLDKITDRLSELFKDQNKDIDKNKLGEFYCYLDSKECKIPFSTKMGKPEKLKKMMDFIEKSKEYKEYTKNVKEPIQIQKNEHINISDIVHIAAQNNDKNLLESLFKYGINVDAKNKYDNTPLHLAVIDSNVQLIKFLLENNANVNEKNKYGNTPLHLAISSNNIEITELLLNYGTKIDERNDSGEMPLHFAALSGYKEVIEKLVPVGIDINVQNKDGWTALMFAAQNGHTKIVEKLIEAGAKVDIQNKDGYTALMFAAKNGHLTVVEALVKAGADVSVQSGEYTVMNLAACNGHVGAVELLLSYGTRVDEKNENNSTPLHFAAQAGHAEVVKLLISKGADVSLKSNIMGNTSLHFAVEGKCVEVIKALLDADTNNSIVNEENKDCNTALHLAALGSNTEVVKLLIEKGANIDIKNAKGKTFLDLVKDSQVCIPLLELVAKYKPENTKDFLSSEPDLISKLSKENNLGKELKEIVDEVENTQRVSKKEGFLPRLVNSKVFVNPRIEELKKIIEKSRD